MFKKYATHIRSLMILMALALLPLSLSAQSLFNQSQSATQNAPAKIGLDPSTLLKPQQAFIPSIHVKDAGKGELVLLWDINPDYYLYKDSQLHLLLHR